MSPLPPSRRAAGLLLLPLLVLAACRREAGQGAAPVQAPSEPAGGSAAAPGAGAAANLAGRLIVMAADDAAMRNHALQLDPASGEWRELWTTSPQGNVTNWTPAPGGDAVAYRIIQRSSPEDAIEALVVRDLASGATARVLAVVDASRNRLAGFGWAPDGASIGFGLQGLAAENSGKAAGWSLRAATLGDPAAGPDAAPDLEATRLLWQAEDPPDQPLALNLEAFDPGRGRAVVSQLATDSGIIASLRLVDLAAGRVSSSLSVTIAGLSPAAAPGTLALPEGAPLADRLRLLDLAGGQARELYRSPAGGSLGRPLWSADGRRLAIAGYPGAAGGTEVLVLDPAASAGAAPLRFALPGGASAPLAFSPDGRWLLAQAGGADEAFGARPTLIPLAGGRPEAAPFTLPAGSWAVSWLP